MNKRKVLLWLFPIIVIFCILVVAIVWNQSTRSYRTGRPDIRKIVVKNPVDPIHEGRRVYEKYGCMMCHGADANSGIRNPNAKTAELVPSLIHVADSYKPQELKDFIRRGQPTIDKMHENGSPPPFRMPSYGKWINEKELDVLQQYLFSLMPKGEKDTF